MLFCKKDIIFKYKYLIILIFLSLIQVSTTCSAQNEKYQLDAEIKDSNLTGVVEKVKLATKYARSKNYARAVQIYQEVIEKYPEIEDAAWIQTAIGYCEIGWRNYSNAINEFKKVIEKYPNTKWASRAQREIGECYFKKGNAKKSLVEFQKVITIYPESPEAKEASQAIEELSLPFFASSPLRSLAFYLVVHSTQCSSSFASIVAILFFPIASLLIFAIMTLFIFGIKKWQKKSLKLKIELVKWEIKDFFKILVLYYLFYEGVGILSSKLFYRDFISIFDFYSGIKGAVVFHILSNLILIFFIAFYIFKKYKWSLGNFGITTYRWGSKIGWGLVGILIYGFIEFLFKRISLSLTSLSRVNLAQKISTLPIKVLNLPIFLLIAFIVIVAIAEELFYRGILYNAIKKNIGIWWGALFSSSFFAVTHFGPLSQFWNLFIFGIISVILYEKTRSLIPSISLHILSLALFFFNPGRLPQF